MGATRIKFVHKDEWKTVRTKDGPEYHHVGSEWVVRKVDWPGYKKKRFRGIYVGPKRATEPKLAPTNSLSESQLNVANWIVEDREDSSPRNRAIRAQQAGEASLVLDCIFDHIDAKFDELRSELDDRLDRLRISIQ